MKDDDVSVVQAIIEAERRQRGNEMRAAVVPVKVGDVAVQVVSRSCSASFSAEVFARRVKEMVCDPATDLRIFLKIGRALSRGLVSENAIFGCCLALDAANSRGAFFVAVAKREFAKAGLSWIEEEWPS